MKITRIAIELLFIQDDIVKRIRTYGTEFEIYIFDQVWPSTALGFGGFGGSAMTRATTYVLVPQGEECAYVYFGDEFAYKVDKMTEAFKKDLDGHALDDVISSGKYNE